MSEPTELEQIKERVNRLEAAHLELMERHSTLQDQVIDLFERVVASASK